MIFGGDIEHLAAEVTKYRIINDLPLGEPDIEVEDFLARETGAECVPRNPAKKDMFAKASGKAVAQFFSAMLGWLKPQDLVIQEEADRRAEICSGCRANVFVDDANCFGCFGLFSKIIQLIGDRKTRMDSSLKFCGACSCSLPIVVFTPLDILDRSHSNSDMPEDTGQRDANGAVIPCWRRPQV